MKNRARAAAIFSSSVLLSSCAGVWQDCFDFRARALRCLGDIERETGEACRSTTRR
jgi:hypothetical protein